MWSRPLKCSWLPRESWEALHPWGIDWAYMYSKANRQGLVESAYRICTFVSCHRWWHVVRVRCIWNNVIIKLSKYLIGGERVRVRSTSQSSWLQREIWRHRQPPWRWCNWQKLNYLFGQRLDSFVNPTRIFGVRLRTKCYLLPMSFFR